MASISSDKHGRHVVQFQHGGKRRTISLGHCSPRSAKAFADKLEQLLGCVRLGVAFDVELIAWYNGMDRQLADKIAAFGLMEPRQDTKAAAIPFLGAALEIYVQSRKDVAKNTTENLRQCQRRLVEFFGPNKSLTEITAADAMDWAADMRTKYAPATVGRTVKRARQFFGYFVDSEWCVKNPFQKVKAPSQVNEARLHFVERSIVDQVLAEAPDAEWRLIICLSRYGGLRVPSELTGLRWTDILFDKNMIRVESPKKRGQATGFVRHVPLFPELLRPLQDVFEAAADGAVYVFPSLRMSSGNLRTRFMHIIQRAGVKPWERVFHNMRASRQTELAAEWPSHIVSSWMGNSEIVARDHYLSVRPEDFQRAAQGAAHDTFSAKTPKRAIAENAANLTREYPQGGGNTETECPE